MSTTLSTGKTGTRTFATLIAALGAAVTAFRPRSAAGASAAELQRLDERSLADIGLTVADVHAPTPIEASARALDQVVMSVGRIHR